MNIVEALKKYIFDIALGLLKEFGYLESKKIIFYEDIKLEHPNDLTHGDFSTNFAMVFFALEKKAARERIEIEKGKNANRSFSWGGTVDFYTNPIELAELVVERLELKKLIEIELVEVAEPGFINIKLSDIFFENSLKNILEKGGDFGNLDIWKGKTILVEHSSPNLFKPFHIGHMMNNTVGETMTRLCYLSGAETKVISYPSDVSLGIGKAVWQFMEFGIEKIDEFENIGAKMTFLGKCYADGTNAMKENPELETRIREITQDIYEHRDTPAYTAYKIGRDLNLEYFINMTARLGSVFDGYIFESEAGVVGKKIIEENIGDVYKESNGAVIFEPTESDLEIEKSLHTRVFINKDGNPTYEAKDTGLLKLKFDRYNPNLSIFVTDSEQAPYFEVVSFAAGKINLDWREKTKHMTHGRMKFKGQKMSSRLGNTPIVSDILATINDAVYEKAGDREMTDERADMISIAAIKYTILRTQPGKPINFDPETSLSFEGDSGPYLQYTYARCKSILRKADELELKLNGKRPEKWETLDLEKYLYRLPEVFETAFLNYAPQQVVGYVTELTQLFNSWYAGEKILNKEDLSTNYKLAIVLAVSIVIKKSLWALGIETPEEM